MFFKKLKLHSPKQLVQFQLSEKLTSANEFQFELRIVWLALQITIYNITYIQIVIYVSKCFVLELSFKTATFPIVIGSFWAHVTAC